MLISFAQIMQIRQIFAQNCSKTARMFQKVARSCLELEFVSLPDKSKQQLEVTLRCQDFDTNCQASRRIPTVCRPLLLICPSILVHNTRRSQTFVELIHSCCFAQKTELLDLLLHSPNHGIQRHLWSIPLFNMLHR